MVGRVAGREQDDGLGRVVDRAAGAGDCESQVKGRGRGAKVAHAHAGRDRRARGQGVERFEHGPGRDVDHAHVNRAGLPVVGRDRVAGQFGRAGERVAAAGEGSPGRELDAGRSAGRVAGDAGGVVVACADAQSDPVVLCGKAVVVHRAGRRDERAGVDRAGRGEDARHADVGRVDIADTGTQVHVAAVVAADRHPAAAVAQQPPLARAVVEHEVVGEIQVADGRLHETEEEVSAGDGDRGRQVVVLEAGRALSGRSVRGVLCRMVPGRPPVPSGA